ncbi:MAG: hypothetical protein ACXVB1_04790 [Pseudobdellovibrionaceae bacterium]
MTVLFKTKIIFQKNLLLVAFLSTVQLQGAEACDQILNPGANLAAAISSAAAGSTLCLNAGDYGVNTLSGIVKTSDVLVQSVSGREAQVSPLIDGTQHVKFQNLTINGAKITNSRFISILNSTFTSQMLVIGSGSSPTPANILIDGNTFDGINYGSYGEGRLQMYDAGGVTVSNNHFGKAGESDGIQWGGYGGVVGPGNVFDGLIQGNYGAHIDSIQAYGQVDHHTITGNFFVNNTIAYAAYDGGANISFTNNVILGQGGYGQLIFGSVDNGIIRHNVLSNLAAGCDNKPELDPSTNCIFSDNILINGVRMDITKCINCSKSYNLADSATVNYCASEPTCGTMGSNLLTGAPTFVGGASPTNWGGFLLTSTSLGSMNASDGTNRGINSLGTPTPPVVLTAPANLRVIN